jgi:hypothetical protein
MANPVTNTSVVGSRMIPEIHFGDRFSTCKIFADKKDVILKSLRA